MLFTDAALEDMLGKPVPVETVDQLVAELKRLREIVRRLNAEKLVSERPVGC